MAALHLLLLVCLPLAASALESGCSASASALTCSPTSLAMRRGAASAQPLSVLAKKQQRKTDNDWDAYVELSPAAGSGAEAVFRVSVPSEADMAGKITVLVNILGEGAKAQAWRFQLRSAGGGVGVDAGANGKRAWRWFLSKASVGWPQGLAPGGTAELVVSTDSDVDVADIDYIALAFGRTAAADGDGGKRRRRRRQRRQRRRRRGGKSSAASTTTNTTTTTTVSAGTTSRATTITTVTQATTTRATTTTTTTATATPATPDTAPSFQPGATWQWQLQGTVDTSVDVDIYDIDLFDVPASTIQLLKSQGRTVVCYFSAGSYEEWRSDAAAFGDALLGKPLAGWPGERWLDIRDIGAADSTLAAIMRARLDLAQRKGCHAVEPDNIDAYQNNVRGGGASAAAPGNTGGALGAGRCLSPTARLTHSPPSRMAWA